MKLKADQINQVNLKFVDVEAWLRVRKVKDHKCKECGVLYSEQNHKIALLTIHGKPNRHICEECGKAYIEMGAIDILQLRKDNEKEEKQKEEDEKNKPEECSFSIIPEKIIAHVKSFCDKEGYKCVDNDDIMDMITESSEIYTENTGSHRWYDDLFVVVDINGLLIGFDGFYMTGDSGMFDMGLEYDLSSVCEVEKKEKVIEYYEAK